MSEKKVVSRDFAIVLGMITIMLSVALLGAITYYTSIISGKNDAITSKDSLISSLNDQVNGLVNMVDLAKSSKWVSSQTVEESASSYVYWTFTADYAGYVSVSMSVSTTTDSYVRVIYSSHGANYDNQVGVVAGGVAVFPILPSASVEIRIGNANLFNGAFETVTITYYY